MRTFQVITDGAEDTINLGRRLAKYLRPGDLLGLIGELGTGKTTFVQGLCSGLGYEGYVTSPTFTLMHLYPTSPPLYHLDCFRLQSLQDLHSTGFEELFSQRQHLVVAEWADRLINYFDDWSLTIQFSPVPSKDNHRSIQFSLANSEPFRTFFSSLGH